MNLLKNPIILALDVDDQIEAFKICDQVGDLVGCVKLGPRLVYKYGADFVNKMSKQTPIFIDNKYFDITSTMVAAVRATFEAGATLVTVHALAGSEALAELAKLETELNKQRPFKILAVTILTSWDQSSLPPNLHSWPVKDHVRSLAEQVYQSGLRGLVCSGFELEHLHDLDLFKVVPGIRLSSEASSNDSALNTHHDQKRVMTPQQALRAGANGLVIGRAILQAKNPRETVLSILESLK